MKISLNKLERLISTKGMIIKKIFTIDKEAIYFELFNINNAESFMLYIPSKYTIKVEGQKNVYKIKYLEFSEDEKEDYNYEAEKQYDEIEISNENINSDELESKLKENYNKPIALNNLNKKDKENIKDIYNQLYRLQFCVQNIKYKISIVYKNYFCSIKRDNSLESYLIKHFNKTDERRIYVNIDLESFYLKLDDISKDIIKVKNGIYTVLNKNQDKNAKILQIILDQKNNVNSYSEIVCKKKNQINEYIEHLEILLQKINSKEAEIIKNISEINKKEKELSVRGLHVDIQISQELSLQEKNWDELNKTKDTVIKDMLFWKTKKQNITLMIDKIFFDNSVMLNKIIVNFSKLSDMVK
jgi:hypothetical protein